MKLKQKIYKAIQKGINEAMSNLSIDDFDNVNTSNDMEYDEIETSDGLLEYKKYILSKVREGDFVYHNGRGYMFEKDAYTGLALGQCCIEAKDSPDGSPRFVAIKDYGEAKWLYNGLYGEIKSLQSLDWDEAEQDFNGWENTDILIKSNECPAAKICKDQNKDYYLPALGELLTAAKNGWLDDMTFWSSTQRDASYTYTVNAENGDDYMADKHDDSDNYVLPFIHITPEQVFTKQKFNRKK